MCVCLPNAHLFILIEKLDVNEVYKHALRSRIKYIVRFGLVWYLRVVRRWSSV